MPRLEQHAPDPSRGLQDVSWLGKCLDGRYRLERQLGAGGAGTVYCARHLGLDRAVAVKVLQRQHQRSVGSRKRFEREARALAQLSHPQIVAVTDCGVDEDVPFLVMELLEGEGLDARLRRGPLEPETACDYLLQLLLGLAFVHERGLVHRDIKPGNLFVEQSAQGERIKLLDFGLAKLLEQSPDSAVTLSGEVFGTPAYMPPEQITGESIDARSDVYAAGLLAFELLAGRRAFQGHEGELLRQQLVEPLPHLHELKPKLPRAAELDIVLQRATDKDKTRRFADAAEMAAALRAALAWPEQPAARASLVPARAARRPQRRESDGLLRTGALLVCVLALAAILAAGSVILLLGGPDAGARRVQLKRAIASLWGGSER
jgi:eukaryotic-like serine/threonine-protein kinase